MNLPQQQVPEGVIPDLREIPLDQLAQLGDTVLAHCLALYRQRLSENGVLLSAFNSTI
jgi:FXSXX-COOH protein